ncbi:MAG: ribosome biogenesis GTPase Der [Clostridia bacterium]|nr:ribosome biogenesis GTPase Der [Clostridia bacterium]
MAKLPLVAIVGRPNVGKSTLFNRIAGKRISIERDEAGVTRDRIYADCEWCGHRFSLVDTGGIDLKSDDEFAKHIIRQVDIALSMSDVIVFVADGKEGLVASDQEVATKLRKSKKPVIIAVNKLDNFNTDAIYDFYNLGFGDVCPISSTQGKGVGDLLDKIVENFDKVEIETEAEDVLKIAIVGKPNAGKSSLINRLVGEDRVIVSSIAGTTRDAVDIPFNYNKQKFMLIDTAGLRRKAKIEDESVERYSVFRAIDAIRRADVCVLVVDSSEEITEQDTKIAGLILEEEKPIVVVLNKWDLIEKDTKTMNKFEERIKIDLAFMSYYKSVYLSALTGKRMEKLMQAVLEVYNNSCRRITTGALNDLIQNACLSTPPPSKNGKKLKIYYATQTGIKPPSFTIFVNDLNILTDNYTRFLENVIRKSVDFSGTPIKINVKAKREEDIK